MFAPSVGDRSKKVAALSAEEVAAKRADALRQNANAKAQLHPDPVKQPLCKVCKAPFPPI